MTPAEIMELAARKIEEELDRLRLVTGDSEASEPWKAVPDDMIGGWALTTDYLATKQVHLANFIFTPAAFYMAMMGSNTGRLVVDLLRNHARDVRQCEGTEYEMTLDGESDFMTCEAAFRLAKAVIGD